MPATPLYIAFQAETSVILFFSFSDRLSRRYLSISLHLYLSVLLYLSPSPLGSLSSPLHLLLSTGLPLLLLSLCLFSQAPVRPPNHSLAASSALLYSHFSVFSKSLALARPGFPIAPFLPLGCSLVFDLNICLRRRSLFILTFIADRRLLLFFQEGWLTGRLSVS